jgi:uncharacterized membrane protein
VVAAALLAVALPIAGSGVPHADGASVAGLVILGVLGTGVAYVLNYQIITSEGATVAATVTYLLPVVAIVLGVLFLGETVTVTVLAGIALVLSGVALTRRRNKAAAVTRRTEPARLRGRTWHRRDENLPAARRQNRTSAGRHLAAGRGGARWQRMSTSPSGFPSDRGSGQRHLRGAG